ncbi:hypothetical protein ACFSYG_08920 [Leeuwenhoekiella polynyae]|uniref:Parallel beta helix pectate lyase-like protein n=1 Tax=Leeuwenhoekiella polynyae TaxID=1550906 RepID=A0A4Q0PGY0_9FLAO|nr:hypothetical protein [Leeuwenhoekiella polynyae]RXG26165.1 hypothetical protein DSM02_158 [Leeuwenhoekiella polynyae]
MKNLLKTGLLFLAVFTATLFMSACREDFEPTRSEGNLWFSKDTVFLDTIFSNIGSSTYNLKVYNNSTNLISIPYVGLSQGENSQYRLNVDGLAGTVFKNIEILPKDSIYIFIETTVDATIQTENSFVYTDQIQFDSGSNLQTVELVTLIQDAIFLYPEKNAAGIKETLEIGLNETGAPLTVEGFLLEDDQLNFTNQKPYVIYGYAGIPSGKTLQIDAGARIHFHENSGLIFANGSRLEATGALSEDQEILENEIILEGDRLEPEYSEVPGQWGTIWFTPGSTASIDYVTIKNNNIGILADGNTGDVNPDFYIKNTQIYNTSSMGLYALTASILGENLVIGNSGVSNLWLRLGGNYEFTHSTFANYWSQSFRNTPAVRLDNFLETDSELFTSALKQATFTNCIIYGNQSQEISLEALATTDFNFSFSHSLIKFDDSFGEFANDVNYDFNNERIYLNILFSENPDFRNSAINDYRIGDDSAAKNLGDPSTALKVPLDILGESRSNRADSGAYQATLFED